MSVIDPDVIFFCLRSRDRDNHRNRDRSRIAGDGRVCVMGFGMHVHERNSSEKKTKFCSDTGRVGRGISRE